MRAAASISAAFLLTLAVTPAALACVPAYGWPKQVELDPTAVASALVASATYIDLAVVEELHPDFVLAEKVEARLLADPAVAVRRDEIRDWYAAFREEMAEDGVRATHRVTARLKGVGSDTFDLSGLRWSGVRYTGEPDALGSIKPSDLKYYLDQTDLAEVEGPGDCYTPLFPIVGQTYLVFRDASGELSRAAVPVRFGGRTVTESGPVYIPVSGPDDPWVKLVREALANQ